MLRWLPIIAGVLCFASSIQAEDNVPPKGFTALFNGKNLQGWIGMPHYDPYKLEALPNKEQIKLFETWIEDIKKHWTVENGELVNDGNGAYLTTSKEFANYELWIDYKTVAKADSGIYLRNTPQVQIWDYTKEGGKWNLGADKGSGGLWNNSAGARGKDPLVLADKPFGQWNHLRIIQVGSRTTVYLNDQLVVDHAILENFWNRKIPLKPSGSIQLQTHGGEIRWKNIYIREINNEEANQILAKANAKDFVSIFNGKDFTGWAGAINDYEVIENSIICKPKKGGNIYTKEEYENFVVRLEFKVPPGGNNGLAIRYPGKGRASQDGMCEIQILDDTAKKYAKLDPRQFCGSAYGIIPAVKGYTLPVGEWNFMEVTVKGHTIRSELNGNIIMEGDVSQVTTFKDNLPHPGIKLLKGHFGFAGHNDPVQYRNLSIKKLSN